VILCYLPTNNDDRVEETSIDDEDNDEHFLSSTTSDRLERKSAESLRIWSVDVFFYIY
jgi:hypothetical protein